MRLYHRVGQLTYKRLFSHHDRAFLRWVLSLKPGDIIGACTGLNHVVAEIKPMPQSWRNGWFISEVRVTDDQGRWHWAPGVGHTFYVVAPDLWRVWANRGRGWRNAWKNRKV